MAARGANAMMWREKYRPPRAILALRPLAGQLVLLIENDASGDWNTEDMLREAGADVAVAHNAYQGILVASHSGISAAALDLSLADTLRCVCERLELEGVPFLFLAGAEDNVISWAGAPVLRRPDFPNAIADMLFRRGQRNATCLRGPMGDNVGFDLDEVRQGSSAGRA